ncbi:MAG: hypothetical protein ACFC03_02200 [Candidatus Malihini olakiniferum]
MVDYLWKSDRHCTNRRVHARGDSIKPLIGSIRNGCFSCLPDQDRCLEYIDFINFFLLPTK